MSTQQVEILFICGSPRARSSEALLSLLEQGAREVGARSRRFLLSNKHLAPCTGCGYCEKKGECVLAKAGSSLKVDDDYDELIEALSYADALAVVSPLYFAGPPAQLKALFDRMQPFWSRQYLLGEPLAAKRPAQIFILGGGGDKHGYEPLVTISKSSLAVAGFSVEKVQNFIGFKYPKDVAPLPSEEEAAEMPFTELSHLRKAAARQQELEQRALAAGKAFARSVAHSLQVTGEEAADAETSDDDADNSAEEPLQVPHPDGEAVAQIRVINRVDSSFEDLKKNARAAKAPKSKSRELDEIIEEAVAHLSEPELPPDETK